jgi:hypothetical protein
MTRQRRWQIKMVRKGKCKICGAPAVTKFLCEKHRLATNTRTREAMHKRNRTKRRYAGAEYAGGKHAATIFHFPKWLLAKPFVLQYHPQTGNFFCMLLKGKNPPIGVGKSVTQAAKRSLRATRNQPQPLGPFQQAFTRVRGRAEVGNGFAITSTRKKRPEKGLFPWP